MFISQTIDYLKTIATELNTIGHTDQAPRFARNIDEAIELMRSKMNIKQLCLIVNDFTGGPMIDNRSDARIYPTKVSFFLLKNVPPGNFPAEQTAYNEAEAASWKIYSRMLREYENKKLDTLLKFFRPESWTTERIGPEFDNCFGIECKFTFLTPVNSLVTYNPADWS